MASLQNTTVPDNGYYRVGTTNTAYVSAGGSFINFGFSAYFDGSNWQGAGGPALRVTTSQLNFYMNPVSSPTTIIFSSAEATTTIGSTTTTMTGTLGVGAAAGTGKILVNAGDTAGNVKPVLEVTNCLGDGSTSTATKSVFKGFLGIQVGSVVGATAVVAGTYYIRLWGT
jgi:hypothetical protein